MTWELIIRSFAVLRKDPKLMLFPALSGMFGLALVALCFYSPWSDAVLNRPPNSSSIGVVGYGKLFLVYCVFNIAVVFCNCALAACVQIRFAGGVPTLADGWSRAATRIRPIALWGLLSATFGVLLRAIGNRLGFLGEVATWLIGFAWELVTYFMVPVLVIEELGVRGSIRRSSGLLRGSWGEQLVVNLSLGWIFVLFAIPGVVLGVLGHTASLGPVPAVLYFTLLIVVLTAVQGIFEVALYRYAVSGEPPEGYAAPMLNGAFSRR